jgi:hypothetical protein
MYGLRNSKPLREVKIKARIQRSQGAKNHANQETETCDAKPTTAVFRVIVKICPGSQGD